MLLHRMWIVCLNIQILNHILVLFICSGSMFTLNTIYIFFIYTAPERNFELAFRMFDFNGDGEVDAEEFSKVVISFILILNSS